MYSELLEVLENQKPSSIAVNVDSEIAFSGGLHAGEAERLIRELGPHWQENLVENPMLAVEFVGTMVDGRLPWYKKLQETAWAIISEGFSERVVSPGKTTDEVYIPFFCLFVIIVCIDLPSQDVEWWFRDKIQALNYTTWFMPSVTIIGPESSPGSKDTITARGRDNVIQYGDLLHVDFGVTALGLNTDTQHLAYVLHPGETEVPKGLRDGLKTVNRLQDIVRTNMKVGTMGNDILNKSLEMMSSEGISGKIYCHPIGDWGHSAGTLIGTYTMTSPFHSCSF